MSNVSDDEIVRPFTPDNQPPPPGPAITVGGVSCAHREIQDIGAQHERIAYLIGHHGLKYVYVIELNSLTTEFDQDYATVFKPMLDSFTFLGAD